ncbi:MAG: hypothetical protein OQL06_04355 [Gammaproteobacteria bacterium]|nr:hypothetical protein [Gammaproteobacteria bacterium]
MTQLLNKSLITALSFLFLMAISPMSNAVENPFGMSDVAADQMQLAGKDGKCGEGKCGEGKCGGNKGGKCGEGKSSKCGGDKKESKCGAGKCGEGKCGGDKKDTKKGKCGQGKCGG